MHRRRRDEVGHGLNLRPFPNDGCRYLMKRRPLIRGRKYESVKAGGPQCGALGGIPQDAAVASDEGPHLGMLLQMTDPLDIGRISAVWQPWHIFYVEGAMTESANETVKCRRIYGGRAVIEQHIHAAARCSSVASKWIARLTEARGTP